MQFLGPKWPIFLNENLISWEIFLAITWKPDFSQACSFCKMLMNHKNFHLTKIPDKTNGMNQVQKPCFWAIFDHCWSFCLMGSFFKKSGSVTHNYIWAPNTMLSFRWKGRRKDRRTNRQTLFYRTLSANSGGPMIYLHFYVDVFSIIYLCIIYFTYAVSKCNVLRSIWFITCLKPIFVLNLPGWFGVFCNKFFIFWYVIIIPL